VEQNSYQNLVKFLPKFGKILTKIWATLLLKTAQSKKPPNMHVNKNSLNLVPLYLRKMFQTQKFCITLGTFKMLCQHNNFHSKIHLQMR
jgi:hypothetical protein